MQYDYLIVGAGLYGATFARRMTDAGKRCLVIERHGHIAGNAYTQDIAE
jgi:UDP-galactopyranose mutase